MVPCFYCGQKAPEQSNDGYGQAICAFCKRFFEQNPVPPVPAPKGTIVVKYPGLKARGLSLSLPTSLIIQKSYRMEQ